MYCLIKINKFCFHILHLLKESLLVHTFSKLCSSTMFFSCFPKVFHCFFCQTFCNAYIFSLKFFILEDSATCQSFPYENHCECYKSSHQDPGACYLRVTIFFLYIHSPVLLQNKSSCAGLHNLRARLRPGM